MKKDTRFELIPELMKLPPSELKDQLIREAKAGEFHDYQNEKYACGKMALSELLEQEGSNLALKIKSDVENGVYDETADENDKEKMRKEMPESMWEMMGLK